MLDLIFRFRVNRSMRSSVVVRLAIPQRSCMNRALTSQCKNCLETVPAGPAIDQS
jgi:hypothetical protein